MRAVTQADIAWILERYRDRSDSSFVVLASVFGFSGAELRAALLQSEYLYLDEAGEGSLLIELSDIDMRLGVLRIRLCAEGRYCPVDDVLKQWRIHPSIRRLVSYVFADDEVEIRVLEKAGFSREVRFREHVFCRGQFRDVLVYGVSGSRP